jgi:hypothetical protein
MLRDLIMMQSIPILLPPPSQLTWSMVYPVNTSTNVGGIAFGDGKFITFAGFNAYSSTDGVAWTASGSTSISNGNAVHYYNGQWFYVPSSGLGNIATSPNGTTWTLRAMPASITYQRIAYGNGMHVAVVNANTNAYATSPDGQTWTGRTFTMTNTWTAIGFGNGLFVNLPVTVPTTSFLTSPDGVNWTTRTMPANGYRGIGYANGMFVGSGSTSGGRPGHSYDGITWTLDTAINTTGSWYGVMWIGDRWLQVQYGSNPTRFAQSSDGVNWYLCDTSPLPNTKNWNQIAYGNGKVIVSCLNQPGLAIATLP